MNKSTFVLMAAALLVGHGSFAFTTSSLAPPRTAGSASTFGVRPRGIVLASSATKSDKMTFDTTSSPSVAPEKQKTTLKKGPAKMHADGIFSPVVRAGKILLGNDRLNEIRGKTISMHASVIEHFVATAESTDFGKNTVQALFQLADANKDGKLQVQEVQAFFQGLGFDWLKEKQVQGLLGRVGADEKGYLESDEWRELLPKTLRTNLVKLAKKNGGDLGFLV